MALEHDPAYTDGVCFHAQQAAEKMLKALLVVRGIPFHKTHQLTYLLDLLQTSDGCGEAVRESAEKLQSYAVEVRYPDAGGDPTREDAMDALSCMETLERFVCERHPPLKAPPAIGRG
jgi:HEPN domain-containing protein